MRKRMGPINVGTINRNKFDNYISIEESGKIYGFNIASFIIYGKEKIRPKYNR